MSRAGGETGRAQRVAGLGQDPAARGGPLSLRLARLRAHWSWRLAQMAAEAAVAGRRGGHGLEFESPPHGVSFQRSCAWRRRDHRQVQQWPAGWWPGPWGFNTTRKSGPLLSLLPPRGPEGPSQPGSTPRDKLVPQHHKPLRSSPELPLEHHCGAWWASVWSTSRN